MKARDEWEAEKKSLSRGVRFANMSLSVNDEEEILALKREAEEREKRHVKEIRGLMMSLDWLKARCKREENLRADAAFAKRYMALQIKLYDACNKADLELLKKTTTLPLSIFEKKKKQPTIRNVAHVIIATIRMKRDAEEWAKSRKVQERLLGALEVMKKQKRKSSSGKN